MRIPGSLKSGRPAFTLMLQSPFSLSLAGEYEVIIDTGFDGFAYVATGIATEIGLTREVTQEIAYADGYVDEVPVDVCTVVIGDLEATGHAYLPRDTSDVLLGIEFLKKIGLHLVVDAKNATCFLTDERQ